MVNASGFGKFRAVVDTPLETNLNMVDLNCQAVMALCQLTVPYMPRGGQIINIASVAAFQPIPYINVYGATKAFVLSFSRALNRELRSQGVRVMALCPFWMVKRCEAFIGLEHICFIFAVIERSEKAWVCRKGYSRWCRLFMMPQKRLILTGKLVSQSKLEHLMMLQERLQRQENSLHRQHLILKSKAYKLFFLRNKGNQLY